MEITITIKLTDDELSNLFKKDEKEVEKKENEVKREYSEYARFFDESCAYWSNDPEMNLMFLKRQEEFLTDKLRVKGCLFLNEVYDALGMPRTKEGQVIGWIFKEDNPYGDNYVSFGIYSEGNEEFVNGYKNSILLDFNVDGLILDYI